MADEKKAAAKPAAKTGDAADTGRHTAKDGRATIGDPDAPITPMTDEDGVISNRPGGTIQSEPTAEDLPSDAKIAPIAEQINPNGNALAVGALEQPEQIAGVDQPEEGKKILTEDMSDAAAFLPEHSDQKNDARGAEERRARFVDRERERDEKRRARNERRAAARV